MIPPEAWQAFGGVLAVVIGLGAGVLALQRLGILRAKPAAPAPAQDKPSDDLIDRVTNLETSVAVLEERTRNHDQDIQGLGRIHQRIDAVSETTKRIEGEISQMNRQLSLVSKHLMGERAP